MFGANMTETDRDSAAKAVYDSMPRDDSENSSCEPC